MSMLSQMEDTYQKAEKEIDALECMKPSNTGRMHIISTDSKRMTF